MNQPPIRRFQIVLTLASVLLVGGAFCAAADSTSYGYVRTLDGRANHLAEDGRTLEALDSGQPLLTGDRIEVAPDSHAELMLADQTIVRLDGSSAVSLDALADSGDRTAPATRLGLDRGNLQVVVGGDAAQPPRVDTANASVYFLAPGSYRVTADGDWTLVVVRDGAAEVRTASDTRELQSDQALEVQGDESRPRLAEREAGPEDALERWGGRLEERADAARVSEVDPSLRYEAAPLEGHGAWVSVDGRRAWQPWVATGWRPYWDGRWAYTPSGLTWVSGEPWGWVTYHYGTWDLAPGFGWVWYPGATYAPAWVYWYWGPSYVGWCPIGYYTRYYSAGLSLDLGFRFGIHGWAGGHWDGFRDWNFVPIDHVRDPHLRHWGQRGYDLRNARRIDTLPRGVITTDTRIVTRERWARPREITADLERTAIATRPTARGAGGALPDLNDFVARRRDISTDLRQIAMPVARSTNAFPDGALRRGEPRSIGSTPQPGRPTWRGEGTAPGARVEAVRPRTDSGYQPQTRSYRDATPRPAVPDLQVPDRNWRGGGRVVEPPAGKPGSELRSLKPREGYVAPRPTVGGNDGVARNWRSTAPRAIEPTQPQGGTRDYRYRALPGAAPSGESWRRATPSPGGYGTYGDSTPTRRIVDSVRRPGGEAGSYRAPTYTPRTYSPPTYTPRTYTPGTYSPPTSTPRTYTPRTYNPPTYSPRVYSPPSGGGVSSAQPRSSGGGASSSRPAPRQERASPRGGDGHKPPGD